MRVTFDTAPMKGSVAILREEGSGIDDGRRTRDVTCNSRILPLSRRDIPLPEGDRDESPCVEVLN